MPERPTQPHYRWWRIWEDDGRSYAIPHDTISPQDARRLHAGHRQFGWAEGKHRPYVSALTFHNLEGGTQTIQPDGYGYTPKAR
jgi:hypothetical protein